MRFLSCALVAIFAEAASAAKSLSSDELNAMIRSGKIDTKTLLKQAVPHHRKQLLRKLEENADQVDAADESDMISESDYFLMYGILGQGGITGDHSVHFNSCVSLTVEEDWDSLENINSLSYFIERGQVQSVRNFVLFNVCETLEDCTNYEISEKNTYMVDLDIWVTAMISYLPDQKDQYCEGCWNQQTYCESVYATGGDENFDYSTAAFFYDEIKFQLIDCGQCQAYGCYDEDGDVYEQNGWDKVDEWIDGLAQCQQTEATWLGLNLHAGFMCNQDGTGLEIGIFVDEDCSLYTSKKSFTNVLSNGSEDWTTYGKSQRVINYVFNYMFDCYGGDLIYVNMYQQLYFHENNWAYDPCVYDSDSGEVYDQEACDEVISENPCYVYSDQDGNQNEIDDDQCAEFMQENPCWTMPGGSVGSDYQEACTEYMASFAHEANSACLTLFGDYNANDYKYEYNNQYNGEGNDANQQNQDGGQFLATSLSGCAYRYQNGLYEGTEANQDEQAKDADGTYDITSDMSSNPMALCNLLDNMFLQNTHLDSQVYDTTNSGQMYDYSEMEPESTYYASSNSTSSSSSSSSSSDTSLSSNNQGSNGQSQGYSVYFPTTNSMQTSVHQAVKVTRKMSPGAIVGTALGTAGGVFILLLGVGQLCKLRKKREVVGDSSDQKDLPLMT